MIKTRWVVVADSAYGRILEYRDSGLEVVHDFAHPESREHNNDLIGNRPNQNQHGMEKDLKGNGPQSLRDRESVRFAKELAQFLATAHAQNRFGELVLVADPRFLGMLRNELAKPVAICVTGSINRHALNLKPPELAELVNNAAHT